MANENSNSLQLLQFEQEIIANCWIASKLYKQFLAEIKMPEQRQKTEVFALLRFSLIASSLVGKCFTHGSKGRNRTLQSRFQVKPGSPILSHDARNNMEHYDERIDMHFGNGVLNGVYTRGELEYLSTPNDRWRIGRVFIENECRILTTSKNGQVESLSTSELFSEIDRILTCDVPPLDDVLLVDPKMS